MSVYISIGVPQSGRGIDAHSAGDVRKALTVNLKLHSERKLMQQQCEREMSATLANAPGIRANVGAG